ncbi:TAXI family TRAP transporter solute-binding subunit [Desulfonatronovibrio magnus]|uniref:TAXI family TRAP transporter solute-binding subunit n=1 Tax=Desulfonatronovibrio magnus TaxID=698827 RepID=UPI0005EB621C|nr:TAXI family TRAP transporter solute-binding subunit [Desulfonatronovibrio magnus]
MKKGSLIFLLAGFLALSFCLSFDKADAQRRAFLAFGGGPTGGTFNYFANGMAIYLGRHVPNLEMSSEGSGGSGENLRRINAGQIDYGIVYSGDAYLGRLGLLPNDERKYENVMSVAYLYGAPAQLVVRARDEISSAKDLVGKRVAVGNAGSGAALSAERFFRHIGIWDDIRPQFLGYSPAASAFRDGNIDAFWVLVGYPNASVIEAATQTRIDLVNLHIDAEESGFYDEYPFYERVVIPGETYRGQENDVYSFQDSTFWCAGAGVDEDIVYESVKTIFSEAGLQHMRTAHGAAREMSIENGIMGASVPLHPGAYRFWSEQGIDIPEHLKP